MNAPRGLICPCGPMRWAQQGPPSPLPHAFVYPFLASSCPLPTLTHLFLSFVFHPGQIPKASLVINLLL